MIFRNGGDINWPSGEKGATGDIKVTKWKKLFSESDFDFSAFVFTQ